MSASPESTRVSRLSTLLAGLVLGAFALAIAGLVLAVAWRAATSGAKVSLSGLILTLALATMAYGLGLLSWRFVADRPNRYQSIFSPLGWKICAICWLVAAIGGGYLTISERDAAPIGGTIGSLVLAIGSWRRAAAIEGRSMWPSNKSLERSRER